MGVYAGTAEYAEHSIFGGSGLQPQSAMRYVEAADPFGKRRIESALPAILSKR